MKNISSLSSSLSLLVIVSLGTFLLAATHSQNPLPKELKDLKAVSFIAAGNYEGDSMPSFFMFTYEVSNIQYLEFLYWLEVHEEDQKLNVAQIDSTGWELVVQSGISGADSYLKGYQKNPDHPVVNISKKGAQLYCNWLTDFWNEKQSKYDVEFRLPSRDEWIYAATSGKGAKQSPYPWGGPYLRNSKGCFLAQHKAIGVPLGPQKVHSYFPNDFGLYNMSGNVAEMVADGHITKGGSWNSPGSALQLNAEGPLEKSPYVGFRPIMYISERK